MPIEWLVEPLLKQIESQIGTNFVLKVFDFNFMVQLLEHPKMKEEHASMIFTLFAQVSLDDTSYALAAQQIILSALTRFIGSSQSSDFLEKA